MATSFVTPDQDAVVTEIFVAAPPERVFRALTDSRELVEWWGQKGMFRATHWDVDLRVGGKWRCDAEMRGNTFWMSGEFLEIDPPKLLVYTWLSSMPGETPSTVRIDLVPESNGTRLKVRHSGLAAHPAAMVNYKGMWPSMVAWLRGYIEDGVTAETRPLPQP
jgi:uncharacterized protein YndB with AHSA1/START domain